MSTREVLDDDDDELDALDWVENISSLAEAVAWVIVFPLIWVVVVFDRDEPFRDRVFFGSWGSALASSFGFGGVLLDDAAYRGLAAAENVVAATVAAFAARPLIIPSAFAALSLAGFAWSAVLYSRERGEGA